MRVLFDDLELDLNEPPDYWGFGRHYLNGVPFTGVSYEYYYGTQNLEWEGELVDGRKIGKQIYYWENGQKKKEYYASFGGGVYNYIKKWDEQGNLIYYSEHYDNGDIKKVIKGPSNP